MSAPTIRKARPADVSAIEACVQETVDDTYGGQWIAPPLPLPEEDWTTAIIAPEGTSVLGVAMTGVDQLTNIWVRPGAQGCGAGSRLLAAAEREIAARGHDRAWLRVVASNTRAIEFYRKRGWREFRHADHEVLGVAMAYLEKHLAPLT